MAALVDVSNDIPGSGELEVPCGAHLQAESLEIFSGIGMWDRDRAQSPKPETQSIWDMAPCQWFCMGQAGVAQGLWGTCACFDTEKCGWKGATAIIKHELVGSMGRDGISV